MFKYRSVIYIFRTVFILLIKFVAMKFVLALFVLALVAAEENNNFFEDELYGPLEDIQTTLKRMKYAKEDFEIFEGKMEVLNGQSDTISSAADAMMNFADVNGYSNDFTHDT